MSLHWHRFRISLSFLLDREWAGGATLAPSFSLSSHGCRFCNALSLTIPACVSAHMSVARQPYQHHSRVQGFKGSRVQGLDDRRDANDEGYKSARAQFVAFRVASNPLCVKASISFPGRGVQASRWSAL